MSTVAAAPATPPSGEPLSAVARITNVFFAPSKTFTDINRSSNWVLAWLVMAVFSYLFIVVAAQKVGWEQINENQMRMNPKAQAQLDQLPKDQRDQRIAIGLKFTKGISYAFPVLSLIIFVIVALVLMATFNFGMGGDVTFGKALAVVIYAHLPGILKVVIAVIFLFLGMNVEGFTFQNPVATNPSALVDMASHPALFALAASLDLFTLWVVALEGIGFACISNVKKSTAMAVVFGWYIVLTLIGVGAAAAFS